MFSEIKKSFLDNLCEKTNIDRRGFQDMSFPLLGLNLGFFPKYYINKNVHLCDRNRRTGRRVACTRSPVPEQYPYPGWGEYPYPGQEGYTYPAYPFWGTPYLQA